MSALVILEAIPGGPISLVDSTILGRFWEKSQTDHSMPGPPDWGFGDGVSPFPGKMRHQSDQKLFKELKYVWRPKRRRTRRGEVR